MTVGDLGWYQRMADRVAERTRAREAREVAERQRVAAENAPRIPPMDGEHDLTDHGEHTGHRTHIDAAHLGLVMCSCGAGMGSYSFVLTDDPLPERCEICDAHAAARNVGSPPNRV